MDRKLSPILIILIVVFVVIIGILIFSLLLPKDSSTNPKNETGEVVKVEPIITLNKEMEELEPTQVTITVYASTETEDGIAEIILPDGTSMVGETVSYTVEENGTYEFTAISNSGGTKTEKIEVKEIVEISATNPYVPEGFFVVNEDTENGFVIEDSYGNQYVWVPVESGKLTRDTILDPNYEESNSTASALVNSVAQFYGFYIGRYEASEYELDGQVTAASMEGKIPWTNLTYLEVAGYADGSGKAFGYTDCKTALINSYAWDTTLDWIDSKVTNYSSNINYGNYSGTIYPTGYTESDIMNNICDLAGNIREWTTEIYKSASKNSNNRNNKEPEKIIHRVVRGGSANLSRTPQSHIYYPENTSDNYWGFRMILYK